MLKRNIWRRIKRQENKARLVSDFGGKCVRCGCVGPPAIYDFHHIDPASKEMSLSDGTVDYERLKREAAKCIMLCANCHREVHAKLNELERCKSSQQLGFNLVI